MALRTSMVSGISPDSQDCQDCDDLMTLKNVSGFSRIVKSISWDGDISRL
jgi:hypothetical protein